MLGHGDLLERGFASDAGPSARDAAPARVRWLRLVLAIEPGPPLPLDRVDMQDKLQRYNYSVSNIKKVVSSFLSLRHQMRSHCFTVHEIGEIEPNKEVGIELSVQMIRICSGTIYVETTDVSSQCD